MIKFLFLFFTITNATLGQDPFQNKCRFLSGQWRSLFKDFVSGENGFRFTPEPIKEFRSHILHTDTTKGVARSWLSTDSCIVKFSPEKGDFARHFHSYINVVGTNFEERSNPKVNWANVANYRFRHFKYHLAVPSITLRLMTETRSKPERVRGNDFPPLAFIQFSSAREERSRQKKYPLLVTDRGPYLVSDPFFVDGSLPRIYELYGKEVLQTGDTFSLKSICDLFVNIPFTQFCRLDRPGGEGVDRWELFPEAAKAREEYLNFFSSSLSKAESGYTPGTWLLGGKRDSVTQLPVFDFSRTLLRDAVDIDGLRLSTWSSGHPDENVIKNTTTFVNVYLFFQAALTNNAITAFNLEKMVGDSFYR